ncbi:MAG: carbohydrate ABC transporter substrate-binding protein [Ruminococcaceae bacterium]|nr:carbohydrate ABC transporter substrate-binding protein [Oscillospiraceae bacterium]
MNLNIKRAFSLILCAFFVLSSFSGCAMSKKEDGKVLKVAVLESAYGSEMWEKICKGFEKLHGDIKIELTAEKNLEDVIGSKMKSGDWPDYVHLATGREAGLTETLIKEEALEPLDGVLEMEIPGEDTTVEEKLTEGFTDTLATNPYSDEKTYLAPMFYSPCGLFYNAGLFEKRGWEVPETWDEMWELGDRAKKEGIYLFTYPTAGYFDSFMFALLAEAGGSDFFDRCMSYEKGIWDTEEAKVAFGIMEKLSTYVEPTTVANANSDNFLKNQQLILDNKALFMPNGTWVVGEMADAPRADGFKWGFCALPAIDEDGDRYSFTFFEQGWIPKEAENKEAAKEFLAYLYSDEAAKIFADSGAVQPIKNASDLVSGDNKLFYSVYDSGAIAVMGGFRATEAVEGVSITETLFSTFNSVVLGDKTVDEWRRAVAADSEKLRKAIK